MDKAEINEIASELLDIWLIEDNFEGLNDAMAENLPLLKKLLDAPLDELADARTDLLKAIETYAKSCHDFESEAKDMLEAKYGYWKQISEDDERFVAHARG